MTELALSFIAGAVLTHIAWITYEVKTLDRWNVD